MRKLLLTCMLAVVAIVGYSQLRWDVKFGMNFSNMTKFDDADALPGFTLGAGLDYEFTENWAFQPGVMFTSRGYKYGGDGLTVKSRPIYMDIPLLGSYKFPIGPVAKFFINAGPYLSVGLGGKIKAGDYDEKIFDDGWKRFDLGLQWGIGFELADHYLVNFTGQHGFISPFDFPDGYEGDRSRNMSFSIGVGYRF